MNIKFENTFELLSQEEWNTYLAEENIDSIYVNKETFDANSDRIMMYSILMEEIDALNNKVGSIKISYALCRHYYDKGIPDNPFYISPGKKGQSVQYFPKFEEEHWMRHYWFNHFSDAVYMKLFSVWDSTTEILDTFYGMGIDKNMRFKFRVMDKLKEINPALWGFLKNDVLGADIYQTAERYRNSFAHYSGPSSVSNSYKIERNKEMTFPEMQEDGSVKMVTKKVTAFSCGVGEYTYVENIMNNLLEFSKFTGDSIQKMLVDMVGR